MHIKIFEDASFERISSHIATAAAKANVHLSAAAAKDRLKDAELDLKLAGNGLRRAQAIQKQRKLIERQEQIIASKPGTAAAARAKQTKAKLREDLRDMREGMSSSAINVEKAQQRVAKAKAANAKAKAAASAAQKLVPKGKTKEHTEQLARLGQALHHATKLQKGLKKGSEYHTQHVERAARINKMITKVEGGDLVKLHKDMTKIGKGRNDFKSPLLSFPSKGRKKPAEPMSELDSKEDDLDADLPEELPHRSDPAKRSSNSAKVKSMHDELDQLHKQIKGEKDQAARVKLKTRRNKIANSLTKLQKSVDD